MGTSTDRTAGRGGAWTPLKHASAALARHARLDTPERTTAAARRVAARHVAVLGGSGAAAGSARAGRSGIQRLGALLGGIGQAGLAGALGALGLERLVGLDRFEVLDELITFVAGDGADLDSVAARDAACEVFDEFFSDADQWTELTATAESTLDRDGLVALLQMFLSHYVYNRVPVVAERLSRLTDPRAARRADDVMRAIIDDVVAIHLPDDPFTVDWAGAEGRAIADDAIRTSYTILESLDEP